MTSNQNPPKRNDPSTEIVTEIEKINNSNSYIIIYQLLVEV